MHPVVSSLLGNKDIASYTFIIESKMKRIFSSVPLGFFKYDAKEPTIRPEVGEISAESANNRSYSGELSRVFAFISFDRTRSEFCSQSN